MVHFSKLKALLLDYFSNTDLVSREQYFVLIGMYGQYIVYQRSVNGGKMYKEDLERVKSDLTSLTDRWLEDVCDPEGDVTAESRIKDCVKSNQPVLPNVWMEEVFLQNYYWQYEPVDKLLLAHQHIVSFYSYKGGTGRTTALLLTAFAMAQMGKKVVLLDFDLESASFFRFFSESQFPRHGILDYLVESRAYHMANFSIPMEDYLLPAKDLCGQAMNGAIFIVPAYGTELLSSPMDCKRALMHADLDLNAFTHNKITPLDYFFSAIHDTVAPDYILVDSRSGLHQIAGILMNRYSSLTLPFFTADNPNAFGMKLILPTLKKYGAPYMMIHAKMPREASVAEKNRQDYLKYAYDAVCCADEAYPGSTALNDSQGEHCPFELPERPELAHVSTLQDLLVAYPSVKDTYESLAREITRRLPPYRECGVSLHTELEKRQKEKEKAEFKAFRAELREEQLAEAEEIIRRAHQEEAEETNDTF